MVAKSTPTTIEKADFVLRVLTFLAVVIVGGGWALYQYKLSGSDGWINNITLETKVLPYHDQLRLLVIHVKATLNKPRIFEIQITK